MAAAACGGEAATAARALCAFSPRDRRLFAISGSDGRLRVWETANSRLQQEYVPSAHLSAACTCLAWAPPGGRPPPSKVRALGEGRVGGLRRGGAVRDTIHTGEKGGDGGIPGSLDAWPRPARLHPALSAPCGGGRRGRAGRGAETRRPAPGKGMRVPGGRTRAPLGSAAGPPPPRGASGMSTRDVPPGVVVCVLVVGVIRSPQRSRAGLLFTG